MSIRIDPGWGYRLPVRFRDGGHGAQREAADGIPSPHETPAVPDSPFGGRLDPYVISQFEPDYDRFIGGTE